MKRKSVKDWLKQYSGDRIEITKHIRIDRAYRGISEKEIKKHILNPENLISSVEQFHDKENEVKFKLRFELSRSRDLGLVVILNERLKVITAYIINKKWQKLWKKK